MKKLAALALGVATLVVGTAARAEVFIYFGYNDLPPPNSGNVNPLPDPWVGSPNTAFLGDVAYAQGSDPDEAGIRFFNNGSKAVTLGPNFTVGSLHLWDVILSSGFSIDPGENVILSGTSGGNFDGSDIGLNHETVTFQLNGVTHAITDNANILDGFPAFDETIPWTEVGAVRFDDRGPGVPEPASWALMIAGFGLAGATLRRRRTVLA